MSSGSDLPWSVSRARVGVVSIDSEPGRQALYGRDVVQDRANPRQTP